MIKIKKIKFDKVHIYYDKELDILTLRSEKTTHHSINFDDFIFVDMNIKNKIVGFEILSISKLVGIPKTFLENIKSAKAIIKLIPEEKKAFIALGLVSAKEETHLAVPALEIPVPISRV